jgi:RimJ/RimL family protein N-acetyltransferase
LADVELAGERVALRPVREGDIERAFEALHGRREILDWLVWAGPERREDLIAFYARWRQGGEREERRGEHGRDYHLAVLDRADGRFSGCISLRFAGHPGAGDLGYWIAVECWGRGFATEAIRLASWLGFGALRAHLIYANVFTGNFASRRALEKSGYRVDRETAVTIGERARVQWCLNATRRSFLKAAGAWSPASARVELEQSDPGR